LYSFATGTDGKLSSWFSWTATQLVQLDSFAAGSGKQLNGTDQRFKYRGYEVLYFFSVKQDIGRDYY